MLEIILCVILGVAVIATVIGATIWNLRRKSPTEGFGDYLFDRNAPFDLDLFPSLVLPKDAKQLKILQLADPQLKFGAFPRRDRKTLRLIKRAVLAEAPDLCVVTGDLTLSVFTHFAVKHFAKFMQRNGFKWAFVFGNHDSQYDCSKYTIVQILKKYDNCLFSVGSSNIYGTGNYLVNVYKGEKTAENLCYSLVMLDSGTYAHTNKEFDPNAYDWIHQSQMDWYSWAVCGLQKLNPQIQSSMFFHIPTKEFANMYYLNEVARGRIIPQNVARQLPNVKIADVKGTVCENKKPRRAVVSGDDGYDVGIFYQGNPKNAIDHADVFAAIKELHCTKAVFCGHDHVNTLKGYYDGVYLAYGLCCGYHTTPFFKKFPSKSVTFNGALWVDEQGNRLEKGVTVVQISLTDDYGALTVTDKSATTLGK